MDEPDATESSEPDCFETFTTPHERTITVKFTTQDGKVFTQSYFEKITIGEIKTILVDVFAVPASSMDLRIGDETVKNEKQLKDFDAGEYATLEFALSSTNLKYVISAENAYQDFAVPDVITVRLVKEDGTYEDVAVEIEDRSIVKPFLGGYMDKNTGIEYQNGYTQTGPPPPRVPPEMKNHRDTQTYWYRNRKLDTEYAHATQMTTDDVWIPNVTDKILVSGPYETADELERRRDVPGKVRIIQRYYHAWKLRKALKVLLAEYKKRVDKELEMEAYNLKADEERKKRELIAKIFPRTKGDFCMIYSMLDRWKKGELQRITNMACGPAKIAEMYMLLEREVEMLQSIENHRKQVKEDMEIQKIENFFHTIGDPITWNCDYKNLPVEMDTLETQKGREYHEIHAALCDKQLDKDGKLQALLNVKLMLRDHNCQISNELVDLVDRACVLLVRGLNERHLEVLQLRIQALLIKHIKLPECSYGVTNRMVRVQEKLMEDNLFYCHRCETLKTNEQFPIHSRSDQLKVCLICSWNDRVKEPWIDVAPYRFILRCIRREERIKSSPSSIAFILQDRDIHHIIVNIWHSHSAINECNDVYKLRLCRWFKDEAWAPWNCILLTVDEAKVHLNIRNLEQVYDPEFLHHVRNKHMLAKKHFTTMMKLENYFQHIGQIETRWNEIIVSEKFVAVNSKVKIFLSCH